MKKTVKVMTGCIICLAVLVFISILTGEKGAFAASYKSRYQKTLNNIYKNGMTAFIKYDARCTFGGKYPSEKEGYPYYLSPQDAKEGQVRYADLDNNGIKEMILKTNENWHIFTQIKKKVKYVATITARNDGGWLYIKKSKKVFIIHTYGGRMTQSYVFRLKGKIIKKVCMIGNQTRDGANDQLYSDYYYNDNLTSEKKYKSIYSKYIKSAKDVSFF